MSDPIKLASFSQLQKPKKRQVARKKKVAGRWYRAGKEGRWEPQCFKCANYKGMHTYRKDEDGMPEIFCKACSRAINQQMEKMHRARNHRDPVDTVCELCGDVFKPKQRGENPILSNFCQGCRTNHRKQIARKPPLEEAYDQLYPWLKHYGHKTGVEIKAEGLQGPTYYDLTRDQREAALVLAKEMIFKETGDDRWVLGHERTGTSRLYSRGPNKEKKTA